MQRPDVDALIEKLQVVPVFERLDIDVPAVLVRLAAKAIYKP